MSTENAEDQKQHCRELFDKMFEKPSGMSAENFQHIREKFALFQTDESWPPKHLSVLTDVESLIKRPIQTNS